MPEELGEVVAQAEAARDRIKTELARLQAQLKGTEKKIEATRSKLQGAEEVVAALLAAKKGAPA